MKVTVITVSDRAYNKEYDDLSGPAIKEILNQEKDDISISEIIVPDDKEKLLQALKEFQDSDFILTTGGTGISSRDITPEVTKEFIEKELPGIQERLRQESLKETPFAVFSRGIAGIKGKTIIINFPGSVKACKLCTKLIVPIMQHAIDMLEDSGHN